MKLKYEAKKQSRINYRFMGFTTFEEGWVYNYDMNKWEKNPSNCNYGINEPCRSVRAFRRKLKKAPKGVEFLLMSRWEGHDVIGFGCA